MSVKANWKLTPEMVEFAGGSRVLTTPQGYAEVMGAAFAPDAMFETAACPEAVCARLREEILDRKPVGVTVYGPNFVDGDLRLTVLAGGHSVDVVVHPEGGYDVVEDAP